MKQASFMIVIKNQQHQTWQGSIRWVEENKEVHFRSALEMIRLMDSALEKEDLEEESVSFEVE